MSAKKKTAIKKTSAKKSAKKPAVKKAKVLKLKTKPVVKKAAKKVAPEALAVLPVTDSTGVVTMKSVDDPGVASEGKVMKLKPTLDKETGVLTMVPVEE